MKSLVPEPTTGILLRLGMGSADSPPVSAFAVRELVVATLIVASPRRWVLVDADSNLTSLALGIASRLGTKRHVVTPAVIKQRDLTDRVHWVASVRGGSPIGEPAVDHLEPAHEVYAFATTGGTSAHHRSRCSLVGGEDRLKSEITYAPLLADLLRSLGGPGWRGGFVRAPQGGPMLVGGSAALTAKSTHMDTVHAVALREAILAARVRPDESCREHLRDVVSTIFPQVSPVHIVLFGSSTGGTSLRRDVDVAVITAGGERQHVVGCGFDILVVSKREFQEAYLVGDLFAHMVSRGQVLFGGPVCDANRTPDERTASMTRSVQVAYAVQLGWDLVRTARTARVAAWAARARWVLRTIQLAIAMEHFHFPEDLTDAAAWWGGTRALALCSGMTDDCHVRRASKELGALLVELGAVPP